MKIKAVLRKILFISLPSLLIFLFLVELGLRLSGVLYLKLHYPKVHINHADRTNTKFNILCLGDSFTFGSGTSFENSYPRQLENLLRKNIDRDINVINAGRMGNTSSLLLNSFEKDIVLYRPDIAIVMIGCNNFWNFEDSSYFKLYKEKTGYFGRIDSILSSLRIYKLIKIGYLSLENSKKNKPEITQDNINNESIRLSTLGTKLFLEGKHDSAKEILEKALIVDKNNYHAYLWLAHIYNARLEFKEGSKELWKAIKIIEEWDNNLIYNVICRITAQKDFMATKEELNEFKRYIEVKYLRNSEKRERLVKLIDAGIALLENSQIPRRVLEYDLKEIIRLAKNKGVTLILQTYPHDGLSLYDVFQEISSKFNIPLVDNFAVFKEIEKHGNINDFFVPDEHCNNRGYQVIAENVEDAILKNHLFEAKKDSAR